MISRQRTCGSCKAVVDKPLATVPTLPHRPLCPYCGTPLAAQLPRPTPPPRDKTKVQAMTINHYL